MPTDARVLDERARFSARRAEIPPYRCEKRYRAGDRAFRNSIDSVKAQNSHDLKIVTLLFILRTLLRAPRVEWRETKVM